MRGGGGGQRSKRRNRGGCDGSCGLRDNNRAGGHKVVDVVRADVDGGSGCGERGGGGGEGRRGDLGRGGQRRIAATLTSISHF